MPKLTLDDIADLRAYERERTQFRTDVIALKKRRRVGVGPIVTFLFENAATVRFQIQEMARAEKIISDVGIETELRIYNPLIPEPGNLSATMFIELTSDEEMREWLPRLVGVETMAEVRIGAADDGSQRVIRCAVDPDHAEQLTREDITAAVHYVNWSLSPDDVTAFATGPVELAIVHPNYTRTTVLSAETVVELLGDLQRGG